jgi:hypothetical protein
MKKLNKKERAKLYLKAAKAESVGFGGSLFVLEFKGLPLRGWVKVSNKIYPELALMDKPYNEFPKQEEMRNDRITALCFAAAMCS